MVSQFFGDGAAESHPAGCLLAAAAHVLSGSMRDLVLRRAASAGFPEREWLDGYLGPDPCVQAVPACPVREAFPSLPFHGVLPTGKPRHAEAAGRMGTSIGDPVSARSACPDGSRALIACIWALHRARRTPWDAAGFGDTENTSPGGLRPAAGTPIPVPRV